ncbi:MAG: sulfatase-like hydrolase/transferase, partial [Deltaproteobacteria bacterium]
DNGWDQEPHAEHVALPGGGPKGKLSMHSLGFRTPLIFRWPERIPAGRVSDALVSSVDLVPTLLDYAGVPPVPDLPGRSLRGPLESGGEPEPVSLVGSARRTRLSAGREKLGDGRLANREAAFFVHTPEWRYIWYADRNLDELYDLEADPDEDRNVAADHPVLVAMFRDRIADWKREMGRPFAARRSDGAPAR